MSRALTARISRVLFRKLWLPKALYEAAPYCYVVGGTGALLSAIYLPGWTWILPYLVLLGAVCLHAGLAVLTLRWRSRRAVSGRARQD
ncbi:MAG: hypothetical protein JSV45_03770 [Chromatiales bacterium]|nr:MAG: hypothetical protein JSV45_03770 [Chromatiales bacterium]